MAATTTQTDADVVVRTFFDALVAGSTRGAAETLADEVWWATRSRRADAGPYESPCSRYSLGAKPNTRRKSESR